VRVDGGAGAARVLQRVAYLERYALAPHRQHGARMQHVGAEERQLRRLEVGERAQRERVAHDLWIGAHDAAHVLPHDDATRAHTRSHNRRCVIRSVTAIIRWASLHTHAP
jgi:hypothetical protein